jgi:hypothetical protein
MRVIGLAGWSGAGKTTLIVKLIPYLRERGICLDAQALSPARIPISIARPARAASSRRFALMHELRGAEEPGLGELLRRSGSQTGLGWGFGLHGALDQTGAVLGPLIVGAALALRSDALAAAKDNRHCRHASAGPTPFLVHRRAKQSRHLIRPPPP